MESSLNKNGLKREMVNTHFPRTIQHLTIESTILLTFMSMATISIAPTPLKEYKNTVTIIWKTPAVKWNQYNIQYHRHIYSELSSLQASDVERTKKQ